MAHLPLSLNSTFSSDILYSSPEHMSFFHLLHDDILIDIIRQLSSRPRKSNWTSFMSIHDIHRILSADGPLQNVSRTLFNKMSIGETEEGDSGNYIKASPHVEFKLLRDLLAVAGPQVEELHIMSLPCNLSLYEIWMQDIPTQCQSLMRFATDGCLDDALFDNLLRSCGAQLQSLTLTNKFARNSLPSIARHCVALRELAIRDPRKCTSSFWKSVGVTLHRLELSLLSKKAARSIIADIQAYCRRLRFINISFRSSSCDQLLARLLISYGPQLDEAALGAMTPDLCEQVAIACPNSRCAIMKSTNFVGQALALGPRLWSAQCSYNPSMDLGDMREAIAGCGNIQSMESKQEYRTGTGFIPALFSQPMHALSVLRFSEATYLRSTDMRVLTTNTGNLVEFCCTVILDDEISFVDFAESNKSIEVVRIALHWEEEAYPADMAEKAIGGIVQSFRACQDLREIKICGRGNKGKAEIRPLIESVKKACLPLRRRFIYVQVFGTDYLA